MSVDLNTLLAILAMAVATVATRIGGLVLIRYVTIGENQKRALEAIITADNSVLAGLTQETLELLLS